MRHEFVELIPDHLDEGVLYVSIKYDTASHLCCCGCGKEVVTPLSPTDWKVIYDGDSVSLYPSIGNWSFDCKSHYWIENGIVRWAEAWSDEEIEAGRAQDRLEKSKYFGKKMGTKKKGQRDQSAKPRTWFPWGRKD
jgi:Family of unknown function (DUF6527)